MGSPNKGDVMDKDELILVSVDDRVVEPPDVSDDHLPAKYRDLASIAELAKSAEGR